MPPLAALRRPAPSRVVVGRRPAPPVRALPPSVEIVGHGIVYFTMFYCTLNWAHYRRLRLDAEERQRGGKK